MELVPQNWKKLNKESFGKAISLWWGHWHGLFFILAMLISAVASIYIWYVSTYKHIWSEEEQQRYLKSQDTRIQLKTKDFEDIKNILKDRAVQSESAVGNIKDVFAQ